jgi:antitoxin MazE
VATAVLGKWGRNIGVRLPSEVVKAAGLRNGERVDVEARGADADAIADAQAAAEEIIAESELYPLDTAEILEMLNEGRRG